VHPEGGKILVNEAEAKRVRAIFALYLEIGTLTGTVAALNQRGWTTKAWTTKAGKVREGRRWTKASLRSLLSNPIYVGKMRLKDEVHEGEHHEIIDMSVYQEVQAVPAANASSGAGRLRRGPGRALLAGLLRCAPCDAAMTATHTTKRGRRYRYYVCRTTRTEGWGACTTKSVPAHEIERLVVDQIRAIGKDAALVAQVLASARGQAPGVDEADLRRALALFDPVWEALHAQERARVLHLLLDRVVYDREAGTVEVAFRPTGIRALAEETEA
jgi:site-specific DNA recombinase